MYWLRPECALWDAIAAKNIGPLLKGKKDIIELGIGNGFFTFLTLGGQFLPDFDWFYSVLTSNCLGTGDMFNHDANIPIDKFIKKMPHTRIRVALDHKQALLSQAARLRFIDELIEHDCNDSFPRLTCSTVYSNMLYWLNDPLKTIFNVSAMLPPGGELVTVFPNNDFALNCKSYTSNDPIWKLVNKGRNTHIAWAMDLKDFESEINNQGIFSLASATRYLSPLTLKIWDLGLRPLASPLIKMANLISPESRRSIKKEWCDTIQMFAEALLEEEIKSGSKLGGYNLVRLIKK